jgi:hypothetical protein
MVILSFIRLRNENYFRCSSLPAGSIFEKWGKFFLFALNQAGVVVISVDERERS